MITSQDAIRTARALIGTPYPKETNGFAGIDCIGLITKVIRTSPGGVKNYKTAGTNTLWDSYNSSKKCKDLTWRQEGLTGAKAGHLAFKRYGEDKEDHVGLVTGEGTVIHSSSVKGEVVETPLTKDEGWDLLAEHRYIAIGDDGNEEEMTETNGLKAVVTLKDETSTLNLRKKASTSSAVLEELNHGAECDVLDQSDSKWIRVRTQSGSVGYVSKQYVVVYETEREKIPGEEIPENPITIIDEAGNRFCPVGDFRVLIGSID